VRHTPDVGSGVTGGDSVVAAALRDAHDWRQLFLQRDEPRKRQQRQERCYKRQYGNRIKRIAESRRQSREQEEALKAQGIKRSSECEGWRNLQYDIRIKKDTTPANTHTIANTQVKPQAKQLINFDFVDVYHPCTDVKYKVC